MKIQNALLQRPDEDDSQAGDYPVVKICDFGLSHVLQSDGKALMVEKCGTGGYIAPEIGSKNTLVGPEIDMWAFGVMLYEMCTAYKPTKLCNYRYGKQSSHSSNFLFCFSFSNLINLCEQVLARSLSETEIGRNITSSLRI